MLVRGFKAIESSISTLPCSTQQALFQLREKLKLEDFRNPGDVRRFEPRSLTRKERVFFPFQGEDYWLVTEINYKIKSIKVFEIRHKIELEQTYSEVKRLQKKLIN